LIIVAGRRIAISGSLPVAGRPRPLGITFFGAIGYTNIDFGAMLGYTKNTEHVKPTQRNGPPRCSTASASRNRGMTLKTLDEICEKEGYAAAMAEADRRNVIWFASAGAKSKPRKFEIYNVNVGETLGTYEAPSISAALDVMARDWGFADYNAVIADYGVSREEAVGELEIKQV
jgi:hypothetical protein